MQALDPALLHPHRTAQKASFLRGAIAIMCAAVFSAVSLAQSDYPITAIAAHEVHLRDTFWAPRLETNRTVTIPYAFAMCETTGRVDNFAFAADLAVGAQCGVYPFDDSDVYKVIEGASYTLTTHPDPQLERYLDSLITLIADAQEADGYLYTARTNKAKFLERWGGRERWSHLSGSHELYNLGHLYEAAAAHVTATGKHTLLDVALKSVSLLKHDFQPGKHETPPGHQEIEIGLIKLFRVTGDSSLVQLAKFFLDQRGRRGNGRELWGTYSQDHVPVLLQNEAVGHAVRELYMVSGMVDVAALGGCTAYADAARRLWTNIITRKMYLTGGVGGQGMIEGFGPAYELPNKSAYCETCASIAHILASQRLFLLYGDAAYVDVLERTLYNATLSGIGMDGNRFFYPNPLASRGRLRSPWFDCACCPSNVTRFVPQIPGFVYAHRRDSVYVNLFVASDAMLQIGGTEVKLSQKTGYPREGVVTISVDPERPVDMTLLVRIPGWARNQPVPGDLYRPFTPFDGEVTMAVGDLEPAPVQANRNGYLPLSRRWKQGDIVRLELPMTIHRVVAHDSVEADRGRVALERGPLVYCAEWVDQPGRRVLNLVLPDSAVLRLTERKDLPGGICTITGTAYEVSLEKGYSVTAPVPFTAVPYYLWAHRGKGEMTVWFPRTTTGAEPTGGSAMTSRAVILSSPGTDPRGISDGTSPLNSRDSTGGRWCTLPGDTSWVEYRFPSPEEVSSVDVYWYENDGICSLPASWRVMLWFDGRWVPAYNPDKLWGVEKDRYNNVVFEAFRTEKIRLEVIPKDGFQASVLEWKVN
jgi:DUF1680 family protein